MKALLAGLASISLLLAGCGGSDDSAGGDDRLDTYRSAIPARQIMLSPILAASTSSKPRVSPLAVGDPALFPAATGPVSQAINGAVGAMIDILEAVVALPPTLFDSVKNEYLWGPFPNEDAEDDFGTVAVYIRQEPEGSDFRFTYAFLRGVGNDVATMAPVIWGGANPDPDDEERGSGLTLWDFEANHAFAQQNDPDYANKVYDRGRFVAVYGRDAAEDDPDAEVTLVLAAFRNFVAKDESSEAPQMADYLYGRYATPLAVVDFMDFRAPIDVDEDDPSRDQLEDVAIRTAFLNEGWGRAEAVATGGDLTATERGEAIECWNAQLERQFLQFELTDNGSSVFLVSEGEEGNCGPTLFGAALFARPLADLDIPTLDDVPLDLRNALDEVATNGVPGDG